MPTLTWVSRDDDLKRAAAAPYRLLGAVPELGAGDPHSGNMLIQGDNLDALKALLPYYAGRVKCTYIDPPYNTRSAFEHYDDNLQHADWLAMIYPRLELLRDLLSEDGSIWLSIDDKEGHYLKVIADEVFGRSNFRASVVWHHSIQAKGYEGSFSVHHNYVHLYSKSDSFVPKNLPRQEYHNVNYSNPDNDPRGNWRSGDVRNALKRPNLMYDIVSPTGVTIPHPPNGWRFSRATFEEELARGKIKFSADGKRVIRKIYLADQTGRVPETLWFADDVGTTREANTEAKAIFKTELFETPKPERLMQRILQIASAPGDLVLDSFLGSGTTAAVAHKMGRRYIGIEMGEHAVTHCAPRLRKVIDGEQGGISESVGWTGGGGFSFYELGEAVFDDAGRINPAIRFSHLAAHLWFSETGTPLASEATGPWLGEAAGRGLALLYNGILGDKSVSGGNVLTLALLKRLREAGGHGAVGWTAPITIYGEASRIGPDRLKAEGVTFKQTPYDLRAR